MKKGDKVYPDHMATYEEIRAKLKGLVSMYNEESENKNTKLNLWEIVDQIKLLEWVLYANSKGTATLDLI